MSQWIKMRKDLRDDPAVFTLSTDLLKSRDEVVGLLYRFWSWVDSHMATCDAPSVTENAVDAIAGAKGFAKSLEKAGWLRVTSRGISIPKFERHLSQGAKRRALAAERMKRHRCDDASVTKTSPDEMR